MLLRGCFVAAKKVAVALDTLIRTQYPRDHLSVDRLRLLRPRAPARGAGRADLARLRVRHEPPARADARPADPRPRTTAANKEIVVITDGEPTAHFEDGQVEFSYPPTRRTIQETLREVSAARARGSRSTRSCSSGRARSRSSSRYMTRAQPRPRVLRDAGAPRRVRAGRLREPPDVTRLLTPVRAASIRGGAAGWAPDMEGSRGAVPDPAVPARARGDRRLRARVRRDGRRPDGGQGAAVRQLLRADPDGDRPKLITPVAISMAVTGIGLIMIRGWGTLTADRRWLEVAIVLYVIAVVYSMTVQRPQGESSSSSPRRRLRRVPARTPRFRRPRSASATAG